MKLNPECMRDILLSMEDVEYQKSLPVEQLYSSLTDYSQDEINYSVLKLEEAGFIDATLIPYDGGILVIEINDITYRGHEFLADIRSDSIWQNVKSISAKVGSKSLNSLWQIATTVITQIIKAELGII